MLVIKYSKCKDNKSSQKETVKELISDLLKMCFNLDYSSISIIKDQFGKPFITGVEAKISVAHTKGLCAVAFSFDNKEFIYDSNIDNCFITDGCFGNVGVDVEVIENSSKLSNFKRIAKKYFSDEENYYLHNLSDVEFMKQFTKIWTIKESICKMNGLGLSFLSKALINDFKDNCLIESYELNSDNSSFFLSFCAEKK